MRTEGGPSSGFPVPPTYWSTLHSLVTKLPLAVGRGEGSPSRQINQNTLYVFDTFIREIIIIYLTFYLRLFSFFLLHLPLSQLKEN